MKKHMVNPYGNMTVTYIFATREEIHQILWVRHSLCMMKDHTVTDLANNVKGFWMKKYGRWIVTFIQTPCNFNNEIVPL